MKSFLQFPLWLLLTISFVPCVFAQEPSYPAASGYVVDQSGIIDSATKSRLEAWILELKQKTTAEVAVVTVNSTEPLTIEDYAVKLFQRFGIGQKGKDNGVLLLVAYKDRHMRIEVGYGLEGAITDAYSSRIINAIIAPEFKAGNFSEGIEKGTAAIVTLVAKEYNITLTGVPQTDLSGHSGRVYLEFVVCSVYFFIFCFESGGHVFPDILGRRLWHRRLGRRRRIQRRFWRIWRRHERRRRGQRRMVKI